MKMVNKKVNETIEGRDGYCWICDETYFNGYHDLEKHKTHLKRISEEMNRCKGKGNVIKGKLKEGGKINEN